MGSMFFMQLGGYEIPRRMAGGRAAWIAAIVGERARGSKKCRWRKKRNPALRRGLGTEPLTRQERQASRERQGRRCHRQAQQRQEARRRACCASRRRS